MSRTKTRSMTQIESLYLQAFILGLEAIISTLGKGKSPKSPLDVAVLSLISLAGDEFQAGPRAFSGVGGLDSSLASAMASNWF